MRIDLRKIFKRMKPGRFLAIVLLLIMLASTITGFALQSLNLNRQDAEQRIVEIPTSNVIDYELTNEQKEFLMRQGKTILEYRYQLVCDNCATQRAYLQAATNELSDQIFLQEIVDDGVTRPTLEMSSFYGRQSFADPTTDQIFDGLCAIMANPPVRCVTKNV